MPESPTEAAPVSRRETLAIALGAALVGLLYRLWLVTRYFGHEEEEWGNLQIARGVAESGFSWIELDHMPGYAWIVAALTTLGLDVETAAVGVAVVSGAAVVGLVGWIGTSWFSRSVGLIAALLVAVQPESALYSATALRESPYLALALLGIALCGERRAMLGGLALSLAFLIRFNAMFSLLPALLIAAWWLWRSDRAAARGALLAAGLLGAVSAGWAMFYRMHPDGGTLRFWGGVLNRNTGGAVADLSGQEHVEAILNAVLGLLFKVFPAHLGPAALLCVPLGALLCLGALRKAQPTPLELRRAWLALCALGTFGLLFATAVVSTYEWFHNLYWKWLTPSVPFCALLGVAGAHALLGVVPRSLRRPLSGVLLISTLGAFAVQTQQQLRLSERMYGVQVLTARWVERAYIEDVAVLADGIPAWYLNRAPSDRVIISWADPRVRSEPDLLGQFLYENRVAAVFWFSEGWFPSSRKAPWLAAGKAADLGPVTLKPVAWSHEYGMIGYAVETAHAVPPPTHQPPPGTWFPPPGDP